MSLTRMDNIADSARFLDNVDLTFALDNRSTTSQQLMSIEVGAKPIVFRASYHDINLIMNITNKALEMYGNTANARAQKPESGAKSTVDTTTARSSGLAVTTRAASHPVASAHVITSKEQVRVHSTLFWTLLTYGIAQSYIRRVEGCAHRGCPRTADVTPEGQAVQH
jgi:vacuolar protein sorting-associated protein 13A/C